MGTPELAPRCSATQLGAKYARARTDSPCRESFVPHTPHAHTTHKTHETADRDLEGVST